MSAVIEPVGLPESSVFQAKQQEELSSGEQEV